MRKGITIRPYKAGDETEISKLIAHTLMISNQKDYSPEYIEEIISEHSPEFFAGRAKDTHFYIACDGSKIVGCGGITGYWGSTVESYLLSIFVLPEYQGLGIGRRIVETLENDEYFERAGRTELASSITAVDFYRKLGYEFKNGITVPDAHKVVRMEKKK